MSLLLEIDASYLAALRELDFRSLVLPLVLGVAPFSIFLHLIKSPHIKFPTLDSARFVIFFSLIPHMVYTWLNFFSFWATDSFLLAYRDTLFLTVGIVATSTIVMCIEKRKRRERLHPEVKLECFGERSLGIIVCKFDVKGADPSKKSALETLIPSRLIKVLRKEYGRELHTVARKGIEVAELEPVLRSCDRTIASHRDARQLGSEYGAKMVIWGNAAQLDTGTEILPNITVIDIGVADFIQKETDFPQGDSAKITLEDLAEAEYPPVPLATPLEFAFVILAWSHILDGKVLAAEEFLGCAIRHFDPSDDLNRAQKSNLFTLKGLVELRNGHFPKARTSLGEAILWTDHRPIVRFTLGVCLQLEGLYEWVRTEKVKRKLIPITPRHQKIVSKKQRVDRLEKRSLASVALLGKANAEFHKVQFKYPDFPYSYTFSAMIETHLEHLFKEKGDKSAAKEHSQKSIRELEKGLGESKKKKRVYDEGFMMIPPLLVAKYRDTKQFDKANKVVREYFRQRLTATRIIMMRFFLFHIVDDPVAFRQITKATLWCALIQRFSIVRLLASRQGRLMVWLALNLSGWTQCRLDNLHRAAIVFRLALLLDRFSICSLHNFIHVKSRRKHKPEYLQKKIARAKDKFSKHPKDKIIRQNSPWFILEPDQGASSQLVSLQTLCKFEESIIRQKLARPLLIKPVDTSRMEGLRWFFRSSLPDVMQRMEN